MVGQEDIIITDRAPTGSCEIEDTLVAEKDWEGVAVTPRRWARCR
jgi:hypothetical protein